MISHHLTQTADAITQTLATQHTAITNAVNLIRQCRDNGGTVYVAGNGGSSSTASHFCNDLQKTAHVRAIDLMSNTALLTAYANDLGYENALANIVNSMGMGSKDVLFVISVSGLSDNIVYVVTYGKKDKRATVVHLGSMRRGEVWYRADVFIEAQTEDMETAEDCHLAICHAITKSLKDLYMESLTKVKQ